MSDLSKNPESGFFDKSRFGFFDKYFENPGFLTINSKKKQAARSKPASARCKIKIWNQPTKKTSFGFGAMVLGVYCTDQDEQ